MVRMDEAHLIVHLCRLDVLQFRFKVWGGNLDRSRARNDLCAVREKPNVLLSNFEDKRGCRAELKLEKPTLLGGMLLSRDILKSWTAACRSVLREDEIFQGQARTRIVL